MKTKNSLKNSIISMLQYLVILLVGFVSQRFFIKILGIEYLGINGLFTNIISMLGIVELGVGSAIIYNLYKPLVEHDTKTINSLMNFYRKTYHIIAFAVFVLGLCVIPFMGLFVRNVTVDVNITYIYILFLLDIVASYILSYKRSILYADQKNYIINIIHMVYYVILNVLQLYYLYLTKNFYGYLIIKIVMRLVENIAINIYVNKKYEYLNVKNSDKLDRNILLDIKKKVSALLFHKIGTFVVMGTDNLIISRYLGLVVVGLYSNYYLIIDALNKLFGQAITALTPSVGHLLVENDTEKNYYVFKRIRFVNFWIAAFSGTGLLLIMKPFIIMWLGSEYLLATSVLIVLVINYYQKMMRNSYSTFKEAAGIYFEDRFVPIFESLTNIIVSIVLVKLIGLPGVFIGTIISGLWLWGYSYPKYVYKKLFDRKYSNYALETIGYFIMFIFIVSISFVISGFVSSGSVSLNFVSNLILTIIIPNIIIVILFSKTENFKYCLGLLKNNK